MPCGWQAVEDLGIHKDTSALDGLDHRDTMVGKAQNWRPFNSYASRHV